MPISDYQWAGPAEQATGASSSSSSKFLADTTSPTTTTTTTTSPGSSMANPIDLTGEMGIGLQHHRDFSPQELQIIEDEMIARNLQEQLDARRPDVKPEHHALGDFAAFDATDAFSPSDQLMDYGHHLQSKKCSKCGCKMAVDGQSITDRMKGLALSQEGPHPYMRCTKCRLYSCVGCGKYHRDLDSLLAGSHQRHDRATNNVDLSKLAYCCDKGRLFMIFSLLCGPDYTKLQVQVEAPATAAANSSIAGRFRTRMSPGWCGHTSTTSPTPTNKSPKSSRPSGSQLSKGTGYGGDQSLIPSKLQLGGPQYRPKKGLKLEISDDLLERYFRFLAILLPHSNRQHRQGFDVDRQEIVATMLPRSPLVQTALELLRDDSMEDMTAKYPVYSALVDFLDAVHSHPDTLVTLFNEHALYPLAQQLVHVSFAIGQPVDSTTETTQSINSALRKLASYCQYYISKAARHKQDFQENDSQRALHIAQRICSVAAAQEADRLEIQISSEQSRLSLANGTDSTHTPSVVTRSRGIRNAEINRERIGRESAAWHRDHRVEEVPDDKFMQSFFYAKEAKALVSTNLARGRMKKLITQLASLRQDLPDGIYVRHASSRVDALKVLIVGPSDTPYELGLFEFDVLCGANFPNKPPEVQFRTTGAGRITFNPNLYNNGKVCLSLLGTWEGQPWIPGESTLEQVLVSIQAMIFTENPWYNEPGRERRVDNTQSLAYNRQIQRSTIRHAMIYWLENRLGQPPLKGPKERAPGAPRLGPMSNPASKGPRPPSSTKEAGLGMALHPFHKYAQKQNAISPNSLFGGPTGVPQGAGNTSVATPPTLLQTGLLPPAPGLTPSQIFNIGPGNQGSLQPTPTKNTLPPGFATGPVYHLGPGGHGPGHPIAGTLPPGFMPGDYYIVGNPIGMQSLPLSDITGYMLSTPVPGHPGVFHQTPVAQHTPAPGNGLLPTPGFTMAPFPQGSLGHPINLEETLPKPQPQPPVPPMNMPAAPAHPIPAMNPLMPLYNPFAAMFMDLTDEEAFLVTHTHPFPLPLIASVDTKPIGNTAADSNDDNIWGDVVRMHFSLKGGMMLAMAKNWKLLWGGESPTLVSEFEASLDAHGFI